MTITYARAGGPPFNWNYLHVFDGETELLGCFEVDTSKGYALVYQKDEAGKFVIDGDDIVLRRIESKSLSIRTQS